MKYSEVERMLLQDIRTAHEKLKNLAPQDSEYVSDYRGKLVDFIFVDNVKTYTNTNHLFNSIEYRERRSISANYKHDIEVTTAVSSSVVPYYNRAVLSPTLLAARQYGKSEYGSYRVDPRYVDEFEKDNRNYMYYMRGEYIYRDLKSRWDGKRFEVEDSIGGFI